MQLGRDHQHAIDRLFRPLPPLIKGVLYPSSQILPQPPGGWDAAPCLMPIWRDTRSPPTAPARPRYEVSSFRRHASGTMQAITRSGTDSSETIMRHVSLALATLIVASGGNAAFAQYDCPGGQRPVPPAVAERMALPLCGFDATKLWAGNMCQLCDSRNMYPNPFVPYPVPRSRYYELR